MNEENIKQARKFLKARQGATQTYDINLKPRWHSTLDGQIVSVKDAPHGYDNETDALIGARDFKIHCRLLIAKHATPIEVKKGKILDEAAARLNELNPEKQSDVDTILQDACEQWAATEGKVIVNPPPIASHSKNSFSLEL